MVNKVNIVCSECGITKAKEYKRRYNKFCSLDCYWTSKRGKPTHALSDEVKRKISIANKNRSKPDSVKLAVAKANSERIWKNESKLKIKIKALERASLVPKRIKIIVEKIRKRCNRCNIELPYEKGNRRFCELCSKEHRREYIKERNSKPYNKFTIYEKSYGVTKEMYDSILLSQKSTCAICKRPFSTSKNTNIDHDHKTGVIRGILCSKCNIALGLLDDNIQRLEEAKQYLQKHC